MKFEALGIIDPILRALHDKGYSEPTPIQKQAIPKVLKRKDILGCAQTGTGKTAAFSVPIIQLIHRIDGRQKGRPVLRSLIVTPTRELAIQIGENIAAYGKYCNIRHAVIFGGVGQQPQVQKLKKGIHILVATPGRLLDLYNQGFIHFEDIKLFVLDEADRMLDMGFIHDIRKLLKVLPQQRQSLFFSATMPDNIIQLSKTILKDPVKVEVTPASSTAETIDQYLYYTNRVSKKELLHHIIEHKEIDQALVFTRTKHGADRVARNLKKAGIHSLSIHGDKSQNQRQKALQLFKEGKLRILVATDIASRGIDIDKLKYVINYDISNEPEAYVHRIGRSGRAGEEGIAISLCEPEENAFIRSIEKLTGEKINVIDDHPFPQTDKPMTEAEKKEWRKEKERRKQEYFANRRKNKNNNKRSQPKAKNSKSSGRQSSDSTPSHAKKSKSKSNWKKRNEELIERNKNRRMWPLEK